MFFTQSPHQSKGDIPGAALGCPRKQRRYFKTRAKKNQAKQINSCLLEMTDWRDIIRQDSKMSG